MIPEAGRPCVVIAVNALCGGGAERVAVDLANEWSRRWRNYAADVILLVGRKQGPYVEEVSSDVVLLEVGIDAWRVIPTVSFVWEVRALLRGYRPLAVISHLHGMNRMMLWSRKLGAFRSPVVAVEQNNVAQRIARAGHGRLEAMYHKWETRWLYGSAHAVVGVSPGVADSIVEELAVDPARVKMIFNCVDVENVRAAASTPPEHEFVARFLKLPRPIVMGVGRLIQQKAFIDLIRAFAQLPEGLRGSLAILGEGPLESELRAEAQKLGVGENVHFPGFMPEPWWFLCESDLFVLSSHWEGFALVVIEALACGTPVVTTDCPYGPRNFITDGENGRLVPPGDILALADAMQDVLSEPQLRGLWSDRSAVVVERFTPAEAVESYARVAGVPLDHPG